MYKSAAADKNLDLRKVEAFSYCEGGVYKLNQTAIRLIQVPPVVSVSLPNTPS